MPITFKCKCGQSITVRDDFAGKAGRCPKCKKAVQVPGDDGEAASAKPAKKSPLGKKAGKKGAAAKAAPSRPAPSPPPPPPPTPAPRPRAAAPPLSGHTPPYGEALPTPSRAQPRSPGSVRGGVAPAPNAPAPTPPPAMYSSGNRPPPPRPTTAMPREAAPQAIPRGPAVPGASPKLLVVNGPQGIAGQTFAVALGRPTVIGRDPEADISIPSERISRRHCQLEPTPDGVFVIMDLGSSNGTLVNQERIAGRKVLLGGEYVQMGDVLLRFSEA
ncbi:FHA domain-containing protein [bacterium]|nr:FHA domain-containing protein [bacterium]